jgi:nicotinamide mononucleotide transporter
VLENWLYWMAADAVTVFLFAQQGRALSAALYGAYAVVAVFGLRAWRRRYREQPP